MPSQRYTPTMPKTPISFKIDSELLERVDVIAGILGMTRTAYFERALEDRLRDHEGLLDEMEEEEGFDRFLLNSLLNKPSIFKGIARMIAAELPDDVIEAKQHNYQALRQEANSRRVSKKQSKKGIKRAK